nr:MAG TPA: hypothetical protein [Caudoviricetes sp.]
MYYFGAVIKLVKTGNNMAYYTEYNQYIQPLCRKV